MVFTYKTNKELAEMTPEQLDVYAKEKRAFEENEQKKSIEAAVKEAQTEWKKLSDEQKDYLEKQLTDLGLELEQVKTNGGASEPKKGTFVEFVEKNIKDNELTDKNFAVQKGSYSAKEVIKVAALMTTANILPSVTGGFSPLFGNYVDPIVEGTPKDENIFMNLVTVKYQPGTENIYYSDRINEDGTAEFIAEGATKPLADADWKTEVLQTKEVAVRWKMTNRLMFHAPSVVEDFREHANELIDEVIDDQLLSGTGLTTNLNGLIANAGAFVTPTGLALYYTDANIYDVIAAMATQIKIANHKGQIHAVLNTVWWAKMAGTKDTEGQYLNVPFRSPDGKTIYDVKVHFSNKVDADDILIGVLKNYNLVISENAIYAEGYENDDFSKNLVSKKLEAFMNGYVKASKDGSILYDSITDVLTDISFVPAP